MPYAELVQTLQPADLLYIKNNSGQLAHVILWLGEVGVSPDGVPLVIDSTGSGHKDSQAIRFRSACISALFRSEAGTPKTFRTPIGSLAASGLGNGEVDEAAEGRERIAGIDRIA